MKIRMTASLPMRDSGQRTHTMDNHDAKYGTSIYTKLSLRNFM